MAGLEQRLSEAIDAGQTIEQSQWATAAKSVLQLQQLTRQPVLWTHNPLARSRPEMVPAKVGPLYVLQGNAAVNEQEAASLLITNVFADAGVDLRIEMGSVE